MEIDLSTEFYALRPFGPSKNSEDNAQILLALESRCIHRLDRPREAVAMSYGVSVNEYAPVLRT